MPYLIDTHAHLDASIYAKELDIIVKHALQDDIWTITVGNDYLSSQRAVAIAERYEGVYAAIGLHPLRVPADITADDKVLNLEKFSELAAHPKVVAIGECGLDYRRLPGHKGDPKFPLAERVRANQKTVLGKFLDLSREQRLPLLLHCRDAHEDMLSLLETWDKTTRGFDSRGILHCFTGNWREARRYFNLDFMISVTGIITHGGYQTEVIRKSPLSRLVLESDCPYLTPVPWSIRRNEPSYLATVAAAVAGMRGERLEDVARQTTQNALGVLKRLRRA
jgi:TatD DNase family protein